MFITKVGRCNLGHRILTCGWPRCNWSFSRSAGENTEERRCDWLWTVDLQIRSMVEDESEDHQLEAVNKTIHCANGILWCDIALAIWLVQDRRRRKAPTSEWAGPFISYENQKFMKYKGFMVSGWVIYKAWRPAAGPLDIWINWMGPGLYMQGANRNREEGVGFSIYQLTKLRCEIARIADWE